MKKILMLITILIMAIASCSSPTAIKNNGGGSDINDNTSNIGPNKPGSGDTGDDNTGSGGNDSGNTGGDNNTGGGSTGGDTGTGGGNGNGSTGGDNGNNGGTTPPTGPSLEQKYKGLALRIARFNESVIDKTYTSDTGAFDYRLIINKDGTVTIFIGSTKYNEWKQYNWDAGWSANPIVIMEKDAYSDRYNPTIDTRTDPVTMVRVRLVNWADNGSSNTNTSQNARRMFEIEFKDDYRQAVIRRTPTGPQMEHIGDFNDFRVEGNVGPVTVTVQN